MKRDLARLPKLARPHDERAGREIEVRSIEPDRLADPEPADREQPDERLVRRDTERATSWSATGGC